MVALLASRIPQSRLGHRGAPRRPQSRASIVSCQAPVSTERASRASWPSQRAEERDTGLALSCTESSRAGRSTGKTEPRVQASWRVQRAEERDTGLALSCTESSRAGRSTGKTEPRVQASWRVQRAEERDTGLEPATFGLGKSQASQQLGAVSSGSPITVEQASDEFLNGSAVTRRAQSLAGDSSAAFGNRGRRPTLAERGFRAMARTWLTRSAGGYQAEGAVR